jgi:hypothetical protein
LLVALRFISLIDLLFIILLTNFFSCKRFFTNVSTTTVLETALFYKRLLTSEYKKQHVFYATSRFNKYDHVKTLASSSLNCFGENKINFLPNHLHAINSLKSDYTTNNLANTFGDILKDIILNPTIRTQKLLVEPLHVHNYSIYDYTFIHIYKLTVKKQLFDDLEDSVELKCFDADILRVYNSCCFETNLLFTTDFEIVTSSIDAKNTPLLDAPRISDTTKTSIDSVNNVQSLQYDVASDNDVSDAELETFVNSGYVLKKRFNKKATVVKIVSTDDLLTNFADALIVQPVVDKKNMDDTATNQIVLKDPVKKKLKFTKKAMQEIYSKDVLSTITDRSVISETQSDSTNALDTTIVVAKKTISGVEQTTVTAPRKRGRPKKNTC